MKRKPIDFRELLERLLPLERLRPADRLRVQRALVSGVAAQIEQAGLMALHQLEQLGAIRRLPPSSANGGESALRFQTPRALDIITLELPPTIQRDGIEVHPRLALVAQARTGLDQVRRLMRLDDPLVSSDPRRGNARVGLIDLLDETGRELVGAASVRFLPRQVEGVLGEATPFDAELALQARSDPGVVIACPDLSACPHLEPEGARRGVRSLAMAGVFTEGGESLGHLEAASAETAAFGVNELAMLALLADCCAFAWERSSRIEKLVFIDPVTGAFNRSYFDRQMLNEMARAEREGASFALCLADIDNFKGFNSTYGYEAGNRVLEHVARTLQGVVRPFDTVARWGGEEFVVLLTAPVQGDDVVTICERLRSVVERQVVSVEALDRREHRVGVTVSMGVALFPDDEKTPQDLFRAANQALLRAKLPPKNRVVYFRPPGEWQSRLR